MRSERGLCLFSLNAWNHKCQSRKNLLKSGAGREVNGEIRHEYILVECFKKQLYSLARKELTFWETGESLSQCLTASDNYDCVCLAARSWIQWPLNSQIYFCCQFFFLSQHAKSSLLSLDIYVLFWEKKTFFHFFPFSQ